MPQRLNGIDQANRVYGSRKELLSPARQLIKELVRRWGRGAGLPAKLGVLGFQLPVGVLSFQDVQEPLPQDQSVPFQPLDAMIPH